MSLAKYSPTLNKSFNLVRAYFSQPEGDLGTETNPDFNYIGYNQLFDEYGYSIYDERDRAGYTEHDYEEDYARNHYQQADLYNSVANDWASYKLQEVTDRFHSSDPDNAVLVTLHRKLVTTLTLLSDVGALKTSLVLKALDPSYDKESDTPHILVINEMVKSLHILIEQTTDSIGLVVNPK